MRRDYKNIDASPWALERFDAWGGLYIGPSSEPHVYKVHGYVCRGMNAEQEAREYARKVAEQFTSRGLAKTVFVVRGPTSTSRGSRFEVTDACAGYSVVAKFESRPAAAGDGLPPGLPLRAAVLTYGLAALRGVPIDVGTGTPVYISDRCLDSDIAVYEDEPHEAFRISRFYGGDTPDAEMVDWIYVGSARVAAPKFTSGSWSGARIDSGGDGSGRLQQAARGNAQPDAAGAGASARRTRGAVAAPDAGADRPGACAGRPSSRQG